MRLVTVISVSLCLCVQTLSAQLLPKADDTFWRDSIEISGQALDHPPLFSLLTVQDQRQPREL